MPATKTDRLQGITTSIAVKAPVVVASTGNLTLSDTQTVDSIAVSTDDRVLAKDQTTVSENGIYKVGTGSWTRATDFDGSRDATLGTVVYAALGTLNGDLWWRVSSTGNNLPGTDNITFAQTAGLTSTQSLSQALDTNDNAINESEGTNVASASTTNIWVADGNTAHITGTSSIDSFSTAPRIGAIRHAIFDGALTLTHSTASLILPGSTNITTVAGDVATIYAETTTLARVHHFEPVTGRPIRPEPVETVSAAGAVIAGTGITILSTDSTSSLVGTPYLVSVPAAGALKEIHLQTSATFISLNTTATTIKFNTTSAVAAAGGSTALFITNAAAAGLGGVVVLRGLSATAWGVVSQSASMSVSTST